jgi:antibiotic biosynthesis monooxygenase (ABM) superfamily enzyme
MNAKTLVLDLKPVVLKYNVSLAAPALHLSKIIFRILYNSINPCTLDTLYTIPKVVVITMGAFYAYWCRVSMA